MQKVHVLLILVCPELPSATSAHVRDLLVAAGVPSLTPEQVLVVAKGGSRMYNLATPTSDTDYIVVYQDSTEVGECNIVHTLYIAACASTALICV